MTPDEKIAAGQRLKPFLADPAIMGAFAELEKRYYDEFIAANSRDDKDAAHSRARVLRDVRSHLDALVNGGEFEARMRERTAQTQNPRRK